MYYDFLPENNLEKKYFGEIVENINSDVTIISKNFGDHRSGVEGEKIILMNADESYRIPFEVFDPSVKMIFKQYCYETQHEKLFPIPLGPSKDFVYKESNILDRKYDVSFVGQIASNREGFFREIAKFLTDGEINSFFGLYQGFNRGLDGESYSKILSNTKIAICPHGTASPETFRFFEASRASCVVVCAQQPDNWIYRDAPYIPFQDKDAPNTYAIVKALLSEPKKLSAISNKVTEYYDQKISPRSVAAYIEELVDFWRNKW